MFWKNLLLFLFIIHCGLMVCGTDHLKVISAVAPAEVAPGEKIAVNVELEVLAVDEPVYLRPDAAYSFEESKLARNIPADNISPWKFEKFKVGDKLKFTVQCTVPENVKPGEKGFVSFRMFRKKEGYVFSQIDGPVRAGFQVSVPQEIRLGKPDSNAFVPPVAVIPLETDAEAKSFQGAVTLPVALDSQTGKPAAHASKLKVSAGPDTLYLLLAVPDGGNEFNREKKFPGHDGAVWNNDGLECIFSSLEKNTDYVQFLTDRLNQHYDTLNGDFAGFNPPWTSSARADGETWVIEAAIPFSAITSSPITQGTVLRTGFFRMGNNHPTGWTATLGSHVSTKYHGLLVFGSLAAALDKQCSTFDFSNARSAEMKALGKRVEELRSGSARTDSAAFAAALVELEGLTEEYQKLLFAEKFANANAPLAIQTADPYGSGEILPSDAPFCTGLSGVFYPGEVRDFAINFTNLKAKPITVRSTIQSVPVEKYAINVSSIDYFMLGLKNFSAELFATTPVAVVDGTLTADALVPNPAGVFTVGAQSSVQLFISIKAPETPCQETGTLLIECVDGTAMEPLLLPVSFAVKASQAPRPEARPFTFGFDFLPLKVVEQHPEFGRQHYEMLRKYGFTTTMLSGLWHMPRPKADAEGNLIGKLDFTNLRRQIEAAGAYFDNYYWDVAIWEKQTLRRDLFGLEFGTPAYEKAFKSWFKACVDEIRSLGIPPERLVVCPYDECMDERAVAIAGWIKSVSPETRIIVDNSSDNLDAVRTMDQYTDVWMPHLRTLPQTGLKEFHNYLIEKGKPRLVYYYSTGSNEKLKKPYADYLMNFYQIFSRRFGGLAYWAGGQYYGDPWYRKAYPGRYDTALFYPTMSGPIPSRRLAAWRRGYEDLFLMREAELRLGPDSEEAEKLRQAAAEAARFPSDHARAETIREYCRTLLEK